MAGSVVNGYRESTVTREALGKAAQTAALFTLLGTDCRENIRIIVSQSKEIFEAEFAFYMPAWDGENPVTAGCSLSGAALLPWTEKMLTVPDEDGMVLLDGESLPRDLQLDCHVLACIPVYSGQTPAGLLATGYDAPREFDPDDYHAARCLAGAIVLQHSHAQKDRRARIGTVARETAHDLNNILSGLVSYPELILMQLDEKSSLKGPISLIHESGVQAAEMVQDFLILARPSEQQAFYPISPSASAKAYCQTTAYTTLATGFPLIRFSFFIAPDLPDLMGSDEFIPKILTTLLYHAAQNISGQGQVSVTIKENLKDPGVEIRIEDSGPETDQEVLARLFDPFFTKKTMGRMGSGLGLSAVKKLVQDQGGIICAGINPGRGNRFDIFLPTLSSQTPSAS